MEKYNSIAKHENTFSLHEQTIEEKNNAIAKHENTFPFHEHPNLSRKEYKKL